MSVWGERKFKCYENKRTKNLELVVFCNLHMVGLFFVCSM